MATFYLDPVGGNDANAGTSYALRWKTFTTGATAARIAPGDTIRIMASPLPTSIGSCTWTYGSSTVTIPANVIKNVDMCESAWTASANVTASLNNSSMREGSNCVSLAVAAGFTTGKIAYRALGATTDFSSYQQLSFYIRHNISTLAASTVKICLCSDTTGDVIVDSFLVPLTNISSIWHAFTVDKGSALGSSIQSVALYADSDPGTVTFLIDDLIACKAPSSADSLSLTSVIGKKNGEGFFPIQSINGTTLKLDSHLNSVVSQARNYAGTSETVTSYKREAFSMDAVATSTASVNLLNDDGTAGNYITYSGGWNRTDMSTQESGEDCLSLFTVTNGLGYCFHGDTRSHVAMEYLGATHAYIGFQLGATPVNLKITSCHAYGCNQQGLTTSTKASFRVTNFYAHHNGSTGFQHNAGGPAFLNNIYAFSNAGTAGVDLSNTFRNFVDTVVSKQNGNYGFLMNGTMTVASNVVTADNGTSGLFNNGVNQLSNCLISESTEVTHSTTLTDSVLYSQKHDQTADNHVIFFDGGRISSETGSNRRTLSGIAWKFAPTATSRHEYFPLRLSMAKIACVASSLVTVKVWVKRDNTGITAKLVCVGGQIAGVTSDVTATASGVANAYEELTITFTPSEAGVVEIEAQVYGGTTYNAYFDDMTISQA
jgi:hypothetical protein